jgi:hypothetical protein
VARTDRKIDYSITIRTPSTSLRVGQRIPVSILVKNISGRQIPWTSEKYETAYLTFDYDLTRNRRPVETTRFHRFLTGRQRADDPPQVYRGGSITLFLPAGASFSIDASLEKLYEIKEPGTYKLRLSHTEDGKHRVFSNVLILKVLRQ